MTKRSSISLVLNCSFTIVQENEQSVKKIEYNMPLNEDFSTIEQMHMIEILNFVPSTSK